MEWKVNLRCHLLTVVTQSAGVIREARAGEGVQQVVARAIKARATQALVNICNRKKTERLQF